MGGTTPLGILGHVADLDDPFTAFDEARSSGLLTNRGTPPSVQVSFPHPLIGAAIYHDLDIAPRASLHRRAATLVEDEAVRIRHHVAACTGTDESLARRVNEHAMSRRAGGAFDSAAAAFRTAAQLTPQPEAREALLLEAAETWLMAGHAAQAQGVLSMLPRQDESPRRDLLNGWLALSVGQIQEAEQILAQPGTSRHRRRPGPGGSGRILAEVSLFRGRGECAAWAERTAEVAGTEWERHVAGMMAMGLATAGQSETPCGPWTGCQGANSNRRTLMRRRPAGPSSPGQTVWTMHGRNSTGYWWPRRDAAASNFTPAS